MRRFVAILAFLPALAAAQAPPCATPLQVAQRLYQARDFYRRPQNLDGLLTPPFAHAVETGLGCTKRKGDCRLGYDPWTDAEGAIEGAPRFTLVSGGSLATVLEVRMDYRLALGGAGSVKIELQRRGNGCWAVSDLISPAGESLFARLSDSQE
ncbi:hypothetical protein [Xanthomonas bundabergensis]|uniref:hypothetical protein n=1 Tax=Xanthomonas bundabergensis TaxID=3160842 RepID=UPI0035163FCA